MKQASIPMHVRHADCFQDNLQSQKKTLRLEIDMWQDGSGKARIDDVELNDFLVVADQAGRKKVIRLLRQAADAIEGGVI